MSSAARIITVDGLEALLRLLKADGRRVVGPTVAGGAIVYDDIDSVADLPRGMTDHQEPGRYELRRRDDDALFGYAAGPQSWKRFLYPPKLRLWRAERKGDEVEVTAETPPNERFAFIGVRACELSAIAIQDRVLMQGAYVDPHYAARRDDAFLVALNCAEAGGACFCVSMGTGPEVRGGHDLVLTELLGEEHCFLIEAGSDVGREMLERLLTRAATPAEIERAREIIANTAANMGRTMPPTDVAALLKDNLIHPRWNDVAQRCLSCTNCTLVCPTCFCTSVEETSDLAGFETSRSRRWDSCFTMDFSYIHGGSVRPSTMARYRQWMTHKLSTWHDQFGTTGCVGCGRCIVWCPVGIDITEESWAIYDSKQM